MRGKYHCRRLCCFYCRPQSRRERAVGFRRGFSNRLLLYTRTKVILCSQFITEINYSFRSQQQMHPFSLSFVAALQGRRYERNQEAVSLSFFLPPPPPPFPSSVRRGNPSYAGHGGRGNNPVPTKHLNVGKGEESERFRSRLWTQMRGTGKKRRKCLFNRQ